MFYTIIKGLDSHFRCFNFFLLFPSTYFVKIALGMLVQNRQFILVFIYKENVHLIVTLEKYLLPISSPFSAFDY